MLEDNVGEYLHNLCLEITKCKKKTDLPDFIKLKSVHRKIPFSEWKGNP